MKKISVLLFFVSFWGEAGVVPSFTPGDLKNLTDSAVESLVKTVAIAGDYHPMMSAAPLGIAIGLDIGIDVTLIKVPDDFKSALVLAGVGSSIPALLPIPRVTIHKGFPFGIDLGFSFLPLDPNLVKVLGFDVKYAIIKGNPALPALAARASYNITKLSSFINTKCFKIDVLVSKKLVVIDPYAGLGVQFASGQLDITTGLPVNISEKRSKTALHAYVGLPLKLIFLNFTGEFDYSFVGVYSIGTRLSFSL